MRGLWLFLLLAHPAFAAMETNAVVIDNPPPWLTRTMVESTVSRIQSYMEWDIRKVRVNWYYDRAPFFHALGFDSAPASAVETVLAFSRPGVHGAQDSIGLGPRITAENFEPVFGHELVHIIVYQKYGDAIPSWLNEGLANFVAKHGSVDYRWLASQPARDVTQLKHPFLSERDPRYAYQAAQAVMEMLASRCGDIHSLLQLSVGQTLESYLSTLCQIPDLNAAFRSWVQAHAR